MVELLEAFALKASQKAIKAQLQNAQLDFLATVLVANELEMHTFMCVKTISPLIWQKQTGLEWNKWAFQ